MKTCLIIPVYNHHEALLQVIVTLKEINLPCFLINDGSSSTCRAILREMAHQENWITLIERAKNGGKGAAVIDGLQFAIKQGFTHAIQIDADGQHCLSDIKSFQMASKNNPEKMILGQPKYDKSIPKKRLYGRQMTNVWIWINTLSFAIKDGMCGFRCYPLSAVATLLSSVKIGQGMDFDIDIVVRLYWQGVGVINLQTPVKYPLDGISHFKMWQDNILISKKHAQLFLGMLWRFPHLLSTSHS